MDRKRFSIVVPVYEAQQYLEECIHSVLRQQVQSWELILVDDGSKDESSKICDRYAGQYPNIRVIHKKNEGPLSARICGCTMACGEYLLSLDADDRLVDQALQTIDDTLQQGNADILIFNYRKIDQSGCALPIKSSLTDRIYMPKEKQELFDLLWNHNAFNLVWNKVFRTKDVQHFLPIMKKLEKVKSGDDVIIVSPLLAQAKKIKTISDCLYEYRMVRDSITHQFNLEKGQDFVLSRTYMLEQFKKAGLPEDIMNGFYKMVYQTSAYLVWNCAISDKSKGDKLKFLRYIRNQPLFQNSLSYTKGADLSVHKKLSLWLFQHRMYNLFIEFEQLKKDIKCKRR